MTETPKKEYKLPEKQRLRAKEAKRRYRMKNKKCRCGRIAYIEILATGQLLCPYHLVNPLKEELTRISPPKPKEATLPSQSNV